MSATSPGPNGPQPPALLEEYYGRRASEYEAIYHRDDPASSAELRQLGSAMCRVLAGRDVLEIACGTGYWTAQVASAAHTVTATDISPEMLAIAEGKSLRGTVRFARASAYELLALQGQFDGGLANFWFSHVPRSRTGEFLTGFHGRLRPGSPVFIADNVYVPGLGGELVANPGSEDTYKRRGLADGSEYTVLKNYYSEVELSRLFGVVGIDLEVYAGEFYWWVSYRVP